MYFENSGETHNFRTQTRCIGESYRRAKYFIQRIKVVNDVAERGVKLTEEHNTKFTKKDDQKRYLLKVCYIFLV